MLRVSTLLLLPAILTGCEWLQELNSSLDLDPPPTADEIETFVRDEAGLGQDFAAEDWRMPADRGAEMLAVIRKAVAQYENVENGPKALRELKLEIKSNIRKAKRVENWQAVLLLSDSLDILVPDGSRYTVSRGRAEEHLGKPEITIRMLFQEEVREEIALTADYYIPLTRERFREVLRLGDTVHQTRFLATVGRLEGARFEYLPTNEQFVVMRARGRED
ncbi:MAG: hypothetical protein QGG73_00180 [Candidatus Hydrogenedentes bacterium]|jgi:hypothetical protein|nr:hypothetical protein [Candidatus Hydrogenedentota bacterium]